ncbi:type II toxin-antitoxin system RelE/ParE family toxin [Candidatus Roizmanbacteria bacterium]|nr:type II toxin-antitoxin system RelE/ParE family toxin [Candidatus Roizmanbacteria bacterium]
MKYQLVLAPKAKKDLDKIDKNFRVRLLQSLILLQSDPYKGKKLKGEFEGTFSLRVWPYRIIYELDTRKKVILVIRIGHRQGVYQ